MKEVIKKNIIERIKAGEVRQIPKWHFVLRSLLAFLFLLAVTTTTIYLMTFVGLVFKEHELFHLCHMGSRGVFLFMHTAPWFLLGVTILLVGVIHILIRKYSFAFTRPLFFTIAGVVIFTGLIATGVFIFDKNSRFARMGEGREIPLLNVLEKEYRQDFFGDIIHGRVVSREVNSFVMESERTHTLYTVFLPHSFDEGESLASGDFVMVLGKREAGIIYAEKIEKACFKGFPDRRGEQRP